MAARVSFHDSPSPASGAGAASAYTPPKTTRMPMPSGRRSGPMRAPIQAT